MINFPMRYAIIGVFGLAFVGMLVAAALSLPPWLASLALPLALLSVLGLVIMVMILLVVTPMVLVAGSAKACRWTRPLRLWWVRRSPHVRVPFDKWRSVFNFNPLGIDYQSRGLTLKAPSFRGEVRSEISTWCVEQFGYKPSTSPRHILPEEANIEMFLRFKNEEDAFAFKMRWM